MGITAISLPVRKKFWNQVGNATHWFQNSYLHVSTQPLFSRKTTLPVALGCLAVVGATAQSSLFKITSAPIVPGIHPATVRIATMTIDPHPLSSTASGGNISDKMTLNSDIVFSLLSLLINSFISLRLLYLQTSCQFVSRSFFSRNTIKKLMFLVF